MTHSDKLRILGLGPTSDTGIFIAKQPQKVFKKLSSNYVANLVIPVGALVHLSGGVATGHIGHHSFTGKCRASIAVCHSIAHGEDKDKVDECSSMFASFMYYSNERLAEEVLKTGTDCVNLLKAIGYTIPKSGVIIPDAFNVYNEQCTNGVHFFYELNEALNY